MLQTFLLLEKFKINVFCLKLIFFQIKQVTLPNAQCFKLNYMNAVYAHILYNKAVTYLLQKLLY